MSTQEERKAELERKKLRLAEIRAEKQRREEEKRHKLLEHQQQGGAGIDETKLPSQAEVEKILSEVGISPHVAAMGDREGSKEREGSAGSVGSVHGSPARALFTTSGGAKMLTKCETTQVNFAPKEQIAYVKATQTDMEGGGREFHVASVDWWEEDELGAAGAGAVVGSQDTDPSEVFQFSGDDSPTHQLAGLLPHISSVKPAEVPVVAPVEEERKKLPDLTEEEKQQILSSNEFQQFFDRTSRILERALTEDVDIFVDYSLDPEDIESRDIGVKLLLNRVFYDEKWSKGRCVSCLDFSPQHPELIAASYNNNEDDPNEPDGVVLIWNSKFKKTTPEYIFHSQSRITSVVFGKFHPNLILGGSYSGQICLWDNRQNKKTPVQRSPLSANAHTHPVYSLCVVGTQNAHNLISISTDGRMCSWSLDMLAQPQEAFDLTWKQSRQVAVTCLSFPLNDVNNFLVGSEEGSVFSGCRHGSKTGITEAYEGHFAPVAGIDCHSAVGQVDFSQLFLTSSFDWTVKLWSIKESKPLYSFENHSDYVFDVAWSPVHPALFCCVDGQGKIELWNLNQDTELPAATVTVEGEPALNKVMWMPSGQQLAVSDYTGRLWLYDVHESMAFPKPDEWNKLAKTLVDIKQSTAEAEELTQAMAAIGGQSPMR